MSVSPYVCDKHWLLTYFIYLFTYLFCEIKLDSLKIFLLSDWPFFFFFFFVSGNKDLIYLRFRKKKKRNATSQLCFCFVSDYMAR